jgi:3-deoxy-D-manno-octulosonic-acid transferase
MNILYLIYLLITITLSIPFLLFFLLTSLIKDKGLKGLKERLGWVLPPHPGSPRIWIHAVSLGEVRVAEAIVNALRKILPGCSITVSSMTEHGRNLARELFDRDVRVIYSPVDVIFFVRAALNRIRPDVLVFLEAEIWPSWITEAKRKGIRIAMINGRISPRSLGRYLKLKPLFKNVLSRFDSFSMIMEEDRNRIIAIGADPSKTSVNGNAKFDLLAGLADPSVEKEMRELFSLKETAPVLIAGSTHTGEEAMIIEAYKLIAEHFPETILFIAPRHIDRAGEIAAILEKNRIEYQRRSSLKAGSTSRNKKVVILDSFGELFKLYSAGSIVFLGGSLVPLGGQNPLEPAVWGKVVLYGPSMEDFLDARALLKANHAGIEVSSPAMLAEKVIELLKDKALVQAYGARAREAVLKNSRSAERHAAVIAGLLK